MTPMTRFALLRASLVAALLLAGVIHFYRWLIVSPRKIRLAQQERRRQRGWRAYRDLVAAAQGVDDQRDNERREDHDAGLEVGVVREPRQETAQRRRHVVKNRRG